jgi:copper chaperone NosL
MIRSLLFAIGIPLLLIAASCAPKGPSVDYGKAECAHCRMTVVDQRFAAAIITKAGRQYDFDDAECMVSFVANGNMEETQVAGWFVCDHDHPGTILDATMASYLHGPAFRSPMHGDVGAFATRAERDQAQGRDAGEALDWQQVKALLAK